MRSVEEPPKEGKLQGRIEEGEEGERNEVLGEEEEVVRFKVAQVVGFPRFYWQLIGTVQTRSGCGWLSSGGCSVL